MMAVLVTLAAANMVQSFIRYPTFARLGGVLLVVAALAVVVTVTVAFVRKR